LAGWLDFGNFGFSKGLFREPGSVDLNRDLLVSKNERVEKISNFPVEENLDRHKTDSFRTFGPNFATAC
jgi:hypothetical protein